MYEEFEDRDFQECYDILMGAVGFLLESNEGVHPLMVAGVLTTLGLSLYKSRLDKEDFEKMVETIMNMTDQIKDFNKKPEKETLH